MQKVSFAIVAAINEEISGISAKMEVDSRTHIKPATFSVGSFLNKKTLLIKSGMGRSAMRTALEYAFKNFDIEFVIHIGSCGGADPHFNAGDIIIAKEVVDSESGARHKIDDALVEKAKEVCAEKNLRARVGTLVTMKDVISEPHEKAFIGTEYDAQCMDMESADLAVACIKANVPFVVARAVLDPLDMVLPNMGGTINEEGNVDAMELARHMIKHPKDIADLPKLKFLSKQVDEVCQKFVEGWIEKN